MHENRETSRTPAVKPGSRPAGEGKSHTARMYVPEESHSGILPMNQSNKDRKPSAENEEGRPLIKENAGQPNTHPTQRPQRKTEENPSPHLFRCYCSDERNAILTIVVGLVHQVQPEDKKS